MTGTNGKTTTSRMIGHVAQRAGWSVGWSSTDGVYLDGVLVEAGDFSGPSGAGQVLRHPGVQLAVTETARGGILRRGVGVAWNDVSVVTNISADHLGVDGIETLDQLAEVKAVITRITRPSGWCVLNADDPRTFAMRTGTRAGVWVFSRDPDSPSGRAVLDAGGRVTTVLDGWVAVLRPGADPLAVVEVADVPMTLAGLSRVNVENALAVASATLALGFATEQVADGLTSFRPGEDNPGRMNLWTLPRPAGGSATVVVDLAHNEAGLVALLEIMAGVRQPGARLLLGVGTAGDRGDDVLVRLGEVAALGADVVEVARKGEYLRGRPPEEMGRLIAEGARHAGVEALREHDDELGLPGVADRPGRRRRRRGPDDAPGPGGRRPVAAGAGGDPRRRGHSAGEGPGGRGDDSAPGTSLRSAPGARGMLLGGLLGGGGVLAAGAVAVLSAGRPAVQRGFGVRLLVQHVVEGLADGLPGGQPHGRRPLQVGVVGLGQPLALGALGLESLVAGETDALEDVHGLILSCPTGPAGGGGGV